LLEDKDERIREATRAGKYLKAESLLWLLIVSNTREDLSSWIFGDWQLKQPVDHSGFDFSNSPFDEVWLMDQAAGGRSHRIYPWDDSADGGA
jgi:hypothetical protein